MKNKDHRDQIYGERLFDSEASDMIDDIQVTANECAKRFSESFGVILDFSEASLASLEKLLSQMDAPPTNMELVVTDLGCYLGEMLTRNLGGHWVVYRGLFHSAISFGGRESGWYHPFHKVHKRLLTCGEEESLEYFYQNAKQASFQMTKDR